MKNIAIVVLTKNWRLTRARKFIWFNIKEEECANKLNRLQIQIISFSIIAQVIIEKRAN